MIKYTLPDFTVGLGLNLFFVRLLEQRPALFQDDVRIDSVYGCFPACNLNGGRAFLRERSTPRQMEEAFSLLAEHGVKARLTLTNMLAGDDDLRDEYLNEMLAIASRYGAEAIVYADLVGDYVRERYGLTNREAEVLVLLARGRTVRYICDELSIAQGTAKHHVSNIYRKVGVHSKQDLLAMLEREHPRADA